MCRYFCIVFVSSILKGKNLLDYTNIFPPNKYETKYNYEIFYEKIQKK